MSGNTVSDTSYSFIAALFLELLWDNSLFYTNYSYVLHNVLAQKLFLDANFPALRAGRRTASFDRRVSTTTALAGAVVVATDGFKADRILGMRESKFVPRCVFASLKTLSGWQVT